MLDGICLTTFEFDWANANMRDAWVAKEKRFKCNFWVPRVVVVDDAYRKRTIFLFILEYVCLLHNFAYP